MGGETDRQTDRDRESQPERCQSVTQSLIKSAVFPSCSFLVLVLDVHLALDIPSLSYDCRYDDSAGYGGETNPQPHQRTDRREVGWIPVSPRLNSGNKA